MRVLVASTRKVRFEDEYSARWIATVSPAGFTVNVASRDAPFKVARIVALNDEETDVVLTVKVALIAPAGTVTLDGTVTIDALLLVRLTTVDEEAVLLRVTVP